MWRRVLRDQRGSAIPDYVVLMLIVGLGLIAITAGMWPALRGTHQRSVQQVTDIVTSGY